MNWASSCSWEALFVCCSPRSSQRDPIRSTTESAVLPGLKILRVFSQLNRTFFSTVRWHRRSCFAADDWPLLVDQAKWLVRDLHATSSRVSLTYDDKRFTLFFYTGNSTEGDWNKRTQDPPPCINQLLLVFVICHEFSLTSPLSLSYSNPLTYLALHRLCKLYTSIRSYK